MSRLLSLARTCTSPFRPVLCCTLSTFFLPPLNGDLGPCGARDCDARKFMDTCFEAFGRENSYKLIFTVCEIARHIRTIDILEGKFAAHEFL